MADQVPTRVQRSREKGARLPANTIVCTRPGRWGNPFKGPFAVSIFRYWVNGGDVPGVEKCPYTRADIVRELGQADHLACFCDETEPCHVDVFIEIIEEERGKAVVRLQAVSTAHAAPARGSMPTNPKNPF